MRKRKKLLELADVYMEALQGKNIPILTIDAKWHNLFPDHAKPFQIKALEKELNALIKKQGNANTDIESLTKKKKTLMKEIVVNMDDGRRSDSAVKFMKKDKNQKMILKINERLAEAQTEIDTLPAQIEKANIRLLVACMEHCYEQLVKNTEEIDELQKWIIKEREELKLRLLKKQDLEMKNTAMYSYLHNMLGVEVMEVFDNGKERIWKGEEDSLQASYKEEDK